MQFVALPISFIPSLWVYFFLCNLKKDDVQYRQNCRKMLLSGVLSTLGVILLSGSLDILGSLSGIKNISPLIRAAFKDLIVAGLAEEIIKHLHVSRLIKANNDRICWIETIAYSGIVGIGFELAEAVIYAFGTNIIQVLVRGITALHVSYGLLMGYYIGRQIMTGQKKYAFLALFVPALIHGLYDFSLSEELLAVNDNFVFLPFIFTIISLVVGIRLLKRVHKNRSNPEYNRPLVEIRREKENY